MKNIGTVLFPIPPKIQKIRNHLFFSSPAFIQGLMLSMSLNIIPKTLRIKFSFMVRMINFRGISLLK